MQTEMTGGSGPMQGMTSKSTINAKRTGECRGDEAKTK